MEQKTKQKTKSNDVCKPFGLNWLTSWIFLLTALFANYRDNYPIMIACLASLSTSLVYHACYHPTIKIIDMTVCQLCTGGFLIYYFAHHPFYYCSWLSAITMFIIYYYVEFSDKYKNISHSCLHVIGNLGITGVIEANYRIEQFLEPDQT